MQSNSSTQTKTRPILRFATQALLLGAIFGALPAQADESRLLVTLKDVRDNTGNLRASIYREPDSFRKEALALEVVTIPAKKGDIQLAFKALPPGRYAIMAYHDADTDGKLGLRFGMFPTEGYGLSNNPKVMGPPKFADSAFDLSGPETSIEIKLSY